MKTNLKTILLFLCAISLANVVEAQLTLGTEFKVNTTTVDQQRNPAIGVDSAGNSFMVWESMQSVADQYVILGQRFDATGTPVGSEFTIPSVNTDAQRFPDVAVNRNGRSVVVWQSMNQDGSENGVYRRVYDETGAVASSVLRVNSTTTGNQIRPKVAMAANGDFVVVWMTDNNDGDGYGIYGKRYNAAGAVLASQFQINDSTIGYQGYPDIAMKPNGDFTVTWQSISGTDTMGHGVYAKRYNAAGVALGGEFQVNVTTAGNQQEPAIAHKANGDFAIVWSSFNQDGDAYGVYGQLYNAAGAVIKPEFLINSSTAGDQGHASITANNGSRYFVSWTNDVLDGDRAGVYFTSIAYDGSQTPNSLVNNRTTDYQQFAALASSHDTSVQFVFQDGLEQGVTTHDTDRFGIYSRKVELPTGLYDTLNPSVCNSYTAPGGAVYTSSGTYFDTLLSAENYDSVYYTINLTVNPAPTITVNASPNDSVCAGGSVTLSGAGGVSYVWTGGVTNNSSFVPASSTTYTVTGTDANGCTNTTTQDIVVNTLPTITATVSPNDTVCAGGSVTLNGGGAVSYAWTGGVTNNSSFVPASSTTYTVTGTDANGCTNTTSQDIVVNTLPTITATASPNDTVCAGGSVTLNGGGAVSYIWTGGVTNNSSFVPASSATYTVTGTDANGCTNTTSQDIVVNTLPTITATASPNDTVCAGGSVTLNGGGAVSYIWTGGVTNNSSFVPASSTTYTVTGTDANGCTNTTSQDIVVNTLPTITATASPNDTVCAGSSVTLNGGGAVSYSWTGGVTNNSSFVPASSATYTVTGTDANGCTNTTTQDIVVNTLPTITATVSPNDTVCAGGSVTLNGGGAVSYIWTGGVTNNSSFVPASSATYTVTGTDANGCTNTTTQDIVVNTLPTITATASPNDTVCAGGSVTLNGGGAVSYIWTGGVTNNSSFVPASSATYTVTGTDANGCTNTTTQDIVVNTLPTITATASPNDTVCAGSSVTLNGGGAVSYIWTGGVTNNSSFVPASSTTYTVTGTDANGCTNTTTQDIVVNTLPTITATVSPNDTVCAGSSVTLNGGGAVSYIWTGGVTNNSSFVPASSATYTVTGTDANGCTNTTSQDIVVNSISLATINPVACNSYTSPSTNYTWTTSGTYMDTIANAAGCDSIITVNLTINNATTATIAPTVCDTYTSPSTNYIWTTSGTYMDTVLNANGCDSVITVNLTVNNSPTITISPSTVSTCSTSSSQLVASGALVYNWMPGSLSGSTILLPANATSATYTVSGLAANGCIGTASVPVTITTPSGNLSQASVGNVTSTPGTQIDTVVHPNDGLAYSYFDAGCNIIASVQETAGGVSLGRVTSMVTVAPSVPTFNGQPYIARWFDIVPATQGPATVTLYFTDDDFITYNANNGSFPNVPTNAGAATTATNLAITKTNGPLGTGTPTVINVVANWNATNSRWEVIFPVTGFSQFRLHTQNPGGAALPIDLTSFTVEKLATSDLVKWTTASETNNSHFNVQRSNDGVDFETLAKVTTKAPGGNSTQTLNYNYIDAQPLIGHNYYRLEQVDQDARASYSRIVDIVWLDGQVVKLYPNPTNDLVHIDFSLSASSQTELKLIDMSGRVVKSILSKSVKGMNHTKVSMSELANGVYHIQLLQNGQAVYNSKVRKY